VNALAVLHVWASLNTVHKKNNNRKLIKKTPNKIHMHSHFDNYKLEIKTTTTTTTTII
jgi:hypothetical protein